LSAHFKPLQQLDPIWVLQGLPNDWQLSDMSSPPISVFSSSRERMAPFSEEMFSFSFFIFLIFKLNNDVKLKTGIPL
jgi:hypothetical protein